MTNQEIARILRNVSAAYILLGENRFKVTAYQNASDSIEHLSSDIEDLAKSGKLTKIPAVGPSIASHLEEILKTGRSSHFDSILKKIPPTIFPLLDLPGFGAKKAAKLVSALKLGKSSDVIKDLYHAAKAGKIASLPDFGEKSQKDILESIIRFRKQGQKAKRMALPFAHSLALEVVDYLKSSPEILKIETLGSLRRMVATIGDIDLAVATEKPEVVLDHFVRFPKAIKLIERGKEGASMILGGGQHVDLRVIHPTAWGSMLQYFTGSKSHNIRLREFALKKGLSLNEYGIKDLKTNKLKEFATEEEFYRYLGLSLVPPEIREDRGEIEAALKGLLPKLISLSQIKGDLQIHSSYDLEPSHDLGKNSMEETITKAKELGYEYIAFSEHNPSVSKHTSQQIIDIMKRRNDKIEQLKESIKSVRILNLLEVDIATNGELAFPEKAFDYIDAALVSIHSSFNQPKEQMTKRVLKGLSHPKAKILAHPTGRIINEREGIDLDFSQIFDYIKNHNKALEINSYPNRLDLPDILVFEAKKYGLKFTLGTDSHDKEGMNLMRYGVSVARRGWLEASDILNTLGYNELLKWLTNRG